MANQKQITVDVKFEAYRRQWYNDNHILFNIIQCMKYRESTFIREGCTHRCNKINAIRYLQMNMERYHLVSEPFNYYHSLSTYPNLPMFSFNWKEKRIQMDDFNDKYLGYMTGYDFLIDLDGTLHPDGYVDVTRALEDALKIKQIFDEHDVIYSIRFSGHKGFHIVVEYDDMAGYLQSMDFERLSEVFKMFAERFKHIEGLSSLDLGVYDLRRVVKCPFSVCYPKYMICLPLSDEQLSPFNLQDMTIVAQMSHIEKLYNRGTLKRDGDPESFGKLVKEYVHVSGHLVT